MKGDKLTPKQEMHAQLIVSTGNVYRAYEMVYEIRPGRSPQAVRLEAHRAAKLPKMQKRIAEIRKENLEKSQLSPEWVAAQHLQLYEEARETGNAVMARRNLRDLGETLGLYKDNLMVSKDITDLSDDEIRHRVTTALAQITEPQKRRDFLLALKTVWETTDANIARNAKPATGRGPVDHLAGGNGAPNDGK